MGFLKQKMIWVSYVFSILFFIYFYLWQARNPIAFDARGYLDLAHSYYDNGFLKTFSDQRTYLYPCLLAIFYKISLMLEVKELFVIACVQFILYLFSTTILVRSISKISNKISNIVCFVFLINIFVFPYITLSLTDLLLFCFFMLWLSRMILLQHYVEEKKFPLMKFEFLMISFLTGMMLALRPAALWICVISLIMFFVYFKHWQALKNHQRLVGVNWLSKNYITLGMISLFILPLLPQLIYNYKVFHKFTPFPTFNFKAFQIFWGVHFLKFGATFQEAIAYVSPFYKPAIHGKANIAWYFKNIDSSFMQTISKLIGAFDFAYIWVYAKNNYSLHSVGSWALGLSSLSIFNTGLLGSISYAINNPKFLGYKYLPLIIFFTWSLFTLPVAIESRFVIPMFLVFIIMSIYQIQLVFTSNSIYKKYFILYYFISITFCLFMANFVRNTVP